jgi:hypothetical protein
LSWWRRDLYLRWEGCNFFVLGHCPPWKYPEGGCFTLHVDITPCALQFLQVRVVFCLKKWAHAGVNWTPEVVDHRLVQARSHIKPPVFTFFPGSKSP